MLMYARLADLSVADSPNIYNMYSLSLVASGIKQPGVGGILDGMVGIGALARANLATNPQQLPEK